MLVSKSKSINIGKNRNNNLRNISNDIQLNDNAFIFLFYILADGFTYDKSNRSIEVNEGLRYDDNFPQKYSLYYGLWFILISCYIISNPQLGTKCSMHGTTGSYGYEKL